MSGSSSAVAECGSQTELRSSRAIAACPVYYGWVILIAAMLGMTMTTPGQTVGVSGFLDSIIADLNLSRSTVSLLYTLGTLGGALSMTWVGRWVDRRGPRVTSGIVAALLALACFGMSQVNNAVTLLLGFTALRALGQGALGLICTHVVTLWFVRRRGFAVGLLGIGMALANAFFPLGIKLAIEQYGWRPAYTLLGVLVAATILPLGAALFRDQPEVFGLQPDGPGKAGEPQTPLVEETWSLEEARRTPLFWLLAAAGFLPGALSTGLMFHHYSIMRLNGLSEDAAAMVFVPIAVITAVTNLLTGIAMDHVEPRRVIPISLGSLAAALLIATRVANPTAAWGYGTLLGLTHGMTGAIAGAAWAYYFGRANHGAIKGFAFMTMVLGAAFGPLPLAWGLDLSGSYRPVLSLLALLPLMAGVAALFVPRPRKKAHP